MIETECPECGSLGAVGDDARYVRCMDCFTGWDLAGATQESDTADN